MKKIVVIGIGLFFVLLSTVLSAQEYSAKVIDEKTGTPIVYATVQTAPNQGLITNEEGVFTINVQQLQAVDSIYVSSLGYQKQAIAWRTATDSIIKLKAKPFELKGVFLTDKQLPVEAIVDSIKAHFATNYAPNNSQKKVFFRQSDLNTMDLSLIHI